MMDALFTTLEEKIQAAVHALKRNLKSIRAGRVDIAFLDGVMVNAYGSAQPLRQVATVGAPEPRLLTVQVWDRALTDAVVKGINKAELGVNPIVEGQHIRVVIPEISQERRQELIKIIKRYGEEARVVVRNLRREAVETIRKTEKEGACSEDQRYHFEEKIQKQAHKKNEDIDRIVSEKTQHMMHFS